MVSLTLLRQHSKLADPREQLRILNDQNQQLAFDQQLEHHQLPQLQANKITTMQVNLGKLCNMTCEHCHVDAGPDRREIMTADTIQDCLNALAHPDFQILDLTGGAPEMNPLFREIVTQATNLNKQVIDRCNLTILLAPVIKTFLNF